MRIPGWAVALALVSVLAACNPDQKAALPQPQEPGSDAVGTICGMNLNEHHGPKGQVFVSDGDQPFWFSSVRDAFTWLLVDDGLGKTVAAIYVNDMGKATDWANPQPGTWVEARHAWFVVASDRVGGMGGAELVPFGERAQADHFAAQHGGRVLAFQQINSSVLNEEAHHD